MKKYIFIAFAAICAISLSGCKVETEGTDPGNDPNPMVTLYLFALTGSQGEGLPPYNPDEDALLRFAPNNKVAEYYYLVELLADKEAFIKQNDKELYSDYVIANGVKVANNLNADVIMQGLTGTYAVTVVALSDGKAKGISEQTFYGLKWETIIEGTYEYPFLEDKGFVDSGVVETTLQICTTDEYLYRFKDLYGTGYSLKLVALPDYVVGPDADGNTFIFCRIPAQDTPYSHPTYGDISVRDIGYLMGDVSYITEGGYESAICIDGPDKNFAYICLHYYVKAGNMGLGYENFYPN